MLHIAATMLGKGVDHLDWDEAVAAAAAKRPNPESVVEAAVERGVLAEDEDGTVGFGIPSFFAYMGEQVGEQGRPAAVPPPAS